MATDATNFLFEALNDENDELDIDDSLRPESIEVDDFSGEERSIHPEIAATMRSDFVRVDRSNSTDSDLSFDDKAATILAHCKRYVVRPYNGLLKAIGWRRFSSKRDRYSIGYKILNFVYPCILYAILICACVAQMSACFSRTKSVPVKKLSDMYHVISCDNHVVTLDSIAYLMIIIAYPIALYTFRKAETAQHLSSLAETVFLSFNDVIGSKSRKKPFYILLGFLACGIVLFFLSAIISILRFIALRLYDDTTIISWFIKNETHVNQTHPLGGMDPHVYTFVHYSLVGLAYLGFLFFDLLYVAATINYCCQCQLLIFYMENIQDKVRNKKYSTLGNAIKEIHRVYTFLKILNEHVGIVTSLIFFIFVSNAILSYSDLIKPHQYDINIATGFINTIAWCVAVSIPVIMAARLTAKGNELRRLGQEIAARPFYYSETSDMELHFFLSYTDSTRYQANLGFIPMQPSYALVVCFGILLFLSSGVIIPKVESVTWF